MKLTGKQQKAQDLLDSIMTKCRNDESFKQQFISSPAETIAKFSGKSVNIPEGKKLVVVDQSNPNHTYINILKEENVDNLELTEEQLELVAGGGRWGDALALLAALVTLIEDW